MVERPCGADWLGGTGQQPGPALTAEAEADRGASERALRQSGRSWGAKANTCKSICPTTGVGQAGAPHLPEWCGRSRVPRRGTIDGCGCAGVEAWPLGAEVG